jgi:chloramphenicol 3-O-phosphotransferase
VAVTSAAVVVVLYGPKAAGKSQVAEVLQAEHGVMHIDVDLVVLRLLDAGIRPHPQHGWLSQICR